jgi:hypothetical protein
MWWIARFIPTAAIHLVLGRSSVAPTSAVMTSAIPVI